jgi:hypothetical protein
MAEPTLTQEYLQVARVYGRFLGFTEDDTAWSSAEAALVDQIFGRALRWMLTPPPLVRLGERRSHKWTWLYPYADFTVWPTTTTTCLTPIHDGGSPGYTIIYAPTGALYPLFPSMVGHSITFVVSGDSYPVVAWDSTQGIVVVGDASGEEGNDFTITADGRYQLEEDFGGMHSQEYVFSPSANQSQGRIPIVPLSMIHDRYRMGGATGRPQIAGIGPKVFEPIAELNIGQRWWTYLWPIPDQVYTLSRQYVRNFDLPTSVSKYIVGPQFSELLIQAGLAIIESQEEDVRAVHGDDLMSSLEAAVLTDRQANVPKTLGYAGNRGGRASAADLERLGIFVGPHMDIDVSYNGNLY